MHWLTNPDDPRVIAALTRRCGICGAKPGQPCHNISPDSPQLNRIIHQDRAERRVVAE
jgi:hypothetical protein